VCFEKFFSETCAISNVTEGWRQSVSCEWAREGE